MNFELLLLKSVEQLKKDSQFSSDSRLFKTTKWCLRHYQIVAIHPMWYGSKKKIKINQKDPRKMHESEAAI